MMLATTISIICAALWGVIALKVWRSVAPTCVFARRTIAIASIASVILILVVGAGIGHLVKVTNLLSNPLPGAAPAEQPEQPEPPGKKVVVRILADNTFQLDDKLDDKPRDLKSLAEVVKAKSASDPGMWVTIESDQNASYTAANQLLDLFEKLKIKNVCFAVEDDGDLQSGTSAAPKN